MRNDVRCVLISDIHFNINTLDLASSSLKAAMLKSAELKVPLVIAGDLNDTKSIMRAECVNAIISILSEKRDGQRIVVIVGNHDLINEKSKEDSLHFLDNLVEVVRAPRYDSELDAWLIPYQSDLDFLRALLADRVCLDEGDTLIMHQGVQGAFMGEYVVDKTSIESEALADFRVISGHYHRMQDIKTGRPRKGAVGLFSYIGTPYSITFAEANDGPKGIQLLLTNGLLEQVPLGLRKHVIIETTVEILEQAEFHGADPFELPNKNDLFWLKVHGPASELDRLSKKQIGLRFIGHENFKLDKIYDEAVKQTIVEIEKLPDDEVLDRLIDDSEETKTQKKFLKTLWREVLS